LEMEMLSGLRSKRDVGLMSLSMAIVPAFPKFVVLCCDLVNDLRKAKGTFKSVNSSAALRSEIPDSRLQQAG
jgi:hypothetical protein